MTRMHFQLYTLLMALLTTVAVRQRPRVLFGGRYWRWLLAPWKLATFALAMTALAAFAPFSHTRNWDIGVAVLMSVLTFATAPWAVGELARRGPARLAALAAWLWSASWSYDVYWFARRGFHPDDWLINLVASSCLYLCAGILWNLEHSPSRGLHLAFRAPDWPSPPSSPFSRVALPVLALMVLGGAGVFLPYVLWRP
jgi:hypothetical protein